MSAPKELRGDLAGTVNYPLYTVNMLTDRHFVVAGGGGAAKTGVTNGFSTYQLSFNGEQCVASEVGKHNSGTKSVMNCATFEDTKGKKMYIVAGLDDHSQLYFVSKKFEIARSLSSSDQNENSADQSPEKTVRQRKPSNKDSPPDAVNGSAADSLRKGLLSQRRMRFLAHPMTSIKTDFTATESFQKVVRISRNGKMMATAGCDGIIRLWQFPSLDPLREIKAHTKEVDDLDFSPDCQKIVSVSKDGCAFVWSVKDGAKLTQLEMKMEGPAVKYLFKRCRFTASESEGQRGRLLTIANPIGGGKNALSYLQLWDTSSFLLRASVPHSLSLSAMAVSPCGRFVATGSMFDGHVNIYTVFNLQLVKHVERVHSNFITGLEFVPCHTITGQSITGDSEAAVISISVDNQIRVHRVPNRRWRTLPVWLALILIAVTLALAFIFCSYLGL